MNKKYSDCVVKSKAEWFNKINYQPNIMDKQNGSCDVFWIFLVFMFWIFIGYFVVLK